MHEDSILSEDEFYDELFKELCPDEQREPSYPEQLWQGDASLRALV
jgi:hypothetical protein